MTSVEITGTRDRLYGSLQRYDLHIFVSYFYLSPILYFPFSKAEKQYRPILFPLSKFFKSISNNRKRKYLPVNNDAVLMPINHVRLSFSASISPLRKKDISLYYHFLFGLAKASYAGPYSQTPTIIYKHSNPCPPLCSPRKIIILYSFMLAISLWYIDTSCFVPMELPTA